MKNNYEFWEKYLIKINKKINKLCNEKDYLYIDLHNHTNYSADGKQSIKELVNIARNKKLDIIAITDHDSLEAFDELYDYVKKGITKPIIIPGIEFTIDNKEYGNQCHILQLFINPKDKIIIKNVKKNKKASFNRSKIQFKRIKENKALQEVFNNNKIKVSYKEYINYLNINKLIPEYDTICSYLMKKLQEKNITTFDVLDKLEKYNNYDIYEDRKEYKTKRYQKLREKYILNAENNWNVRFLLSMLAVREVDDDWWPKPSSGSLSVNSYGGLKINELNQKYKTIFAHPTESKISIVKNIINDKKSIIGLEDNVRNIYENKDLFNNLLKELDLLKIIGSDNHGKMEYIYDNINDFKIESDELKRLL